MLLDENLFDDVTISEPVITEVPAVSVDPVTVQEIELEGPQTGTETSMSAIIMDLVKDEYSTVEAYNHAKVDAEANGFTNLVSTLDSIAGEELVHVGELERLLKELSPNTENIESGKVEAEQDMMGIDPTIVESININEEAIGQCTLEFIGKRGDTMVREYYPDFESAKKQFDDLVPLYSSDPDLVYALRITDEASNELASWEYDEKKGESLKEEYIDAETVSSIVKDAAAQAKGKNKAVLDAVADNYANADYGVEIDEVDEALNSGKIDKDTFTDLVKHSNDETEKQLTAAKNSEEEKNALQAQVNTITSLTEDVNSDDEIISKFLEDMNKDLSAIKNKEERK